MSKSSTVCVVCILAMGLAGCKRSTAPVTGRLVFAARDLTKGDKVSEKDLVIRTVPKRYEESLDEAVREEDVSLLVGSPIETSVQRGQALCFKHFVTDRPPSISQKLSRGRVAFALRVDPDKIPLDVVRPNDQVELVGMFVVDGSPRAIQIIEGPRVIAIDSRTVVDREASRWAARSQPPQTQPHDAPKREACMLTIEVTPEVSLALANVLSYVLEDVRVNVIADPGYVSQGTIQVNPTLERRIDKAAVPVWRIQDTPGPVVEYE